MNKEEVKFSLKGIKPLEYSMARMIQTEIIKENVYEIPLAFIVRIIQHYERIKEELE